MNRRGGPENGDPITQKSEHFGPFYLLNIGVGRMVLQSVQEWGSGAAGMLALGGGLMPDIGPSASIFIQVHVWPELKGKHNVRGCGV